MEPRTVYFLLFLAIASPLIWWLMWREDFDGIRSGWRWRCERKSRQRLSIQQFYSQFYQSSEVPEHLVARLLAMQSEFWKVDAELIRPHDNYPRIFGDDGEFIKQIESEFNLTITDDDLESVDGSFDSIARYLHSRLRIAT